MYAKIFRQIYDGTLAADWQVMVVFQQLLILSDQHGVVDMTPEAIARTTNIPLDIIRHGLTKLAEPDPYSRTAKNEGRRIELLDPARPWGWQIVNHRYYRDLISRADRNEKRRIEIAEQRQVKKVTKLSMSQSVANVPHTDTDTDTDTYTDTDKRLKTLKTLAQKEFCASSFEEFWKRYPRKKSKGQAKKAWLKIKPDEQLVALIFAKIEQAKKSGDWQKEDDTYIPYPATWLNAQGWEDEHVERQDNSITAHNLRLINQGCKRDDHRTKADIQCGDNRLGSGIPPKD